MFDGRKKKPGTYGQQTGVRGVYVEFLYDDIMHGIPAFKSILGSDVFTQIYGAPVRWVPIYNKMKGADFNSKVQKMFLQQGQVMQCLDKIAVEVLTDIDLSHNITKKGGGTITTSLRQLIMQFKSKKSNEQVFLTIDEDFYNSGYTIIYKKIYSMEASLYANHIGAYLKRDIGNDTLKMFDALAQIKNQQHRVDR